MISRRTLVGASAAVVLGPRKARAADRKRLGLFSPVFLPDEAQPLVRILLRSLADRGYGGENAPLLFPRTIKGDFTALPAVVREFGSLSLDAILTIGYPMTAALARAGLPVVVAFGAGDPVATGLAATLAHPGGSVTGVFDDVALLTIKRLHLLAELVPSARRIAVLWNADDRGMTLRYEAMMPAASELRVELWPLGVREPDDFEEAFGAMDKGRPDALIMIADGLTNLNRTRVVAWAERARVPAIYELDAVVREGGLLSYGADLKEAFERAGALVGRLFEGARAGDLPFEQATRYTLAVNTRSAQAIGVAVPVALLAQADEVIE